MNAAPSLQGALWNGNAQLATKNQLISSISGLYTDLQDLSGFQFQNLDVSTLTVRNWISAPTLYVSSLYAANIDLSGIAIDPSGVFIVNDISANQSYFNITNISVMKMEFKPTFTGNIQVTFDLGLGQAIGGLAAGLGAAVGGAAIGVGTAVGLAIQGAEQGIATMVAGRPQNFITNNTYETINFTSQLQVSTLGNAAPYYSSIFRTVSSVSANQVPGKEIFTSTIFYPGQICIRTVSDPINLITGDSNLNTSTIQSFGQWCPLEGLEPTNIDADSISTINLSSGNLFASLGQIETLESYSGVFSNAGFAQSASLAYQAPLQFQTGATNGAAFIGNLNRLYCYNDTGYIFSGTPGTTEMGSLYLGQNANESLLNISSIYSQGQIKTVDFYASTITAEQLNVVSTLFLTSTNIEIITSTQTINADNLIATNASIANFISSFSFTTGVGNPSGSYDINKNFSLFSTSYNGVSSLTNNILNYQMNLQIQDQTSFNLNIAETSFGVLYKLSPTNASQWGSTLMIFNDYQNPGGIELPVASVFQQAGLTGTFDIQTQYNPNTPGYYSAFSIVQDWIPGSEFSTFSTFLSVSGPNPPTPVPLVYQRYTIGSSGWIESIENNPAPYETENNNTFTISQDINDVTLATTDRLNLKAGEIFFEGAVNLNDINVNTVNVVNGNFQNLQASNIQVTAVNVTDIDTQSNYSGSYNAVPTLTPLKMGFSSITSTDFTNIYPLTNPSRSPNYFNSLNLTQWNQSAYTATYGSAVEVPHIMVGDLFAFTPPAVYSGQFYINNTISSPPQPIPILQNVAGYGSTIGTVAGGTYARVRTSNGTNWAIDSNISNPQGGTFQPYTYQSQVTTSVNENSVVSLTQQPTFVVAPTVQVNTNKILLAAPIVRTYTYGSPSWTTREAGIEYSSYFDSNVVFLDGNTYSDAMNPILNPLGNLYYAYSAWSAQVWFGRIRTESFGIQGMDVIGGPLLYAGTTEYIWQSIRYLNVVGTAGSVSADIREMYLMIPANYMSITSFAGAW